MYNQGRDGFQQQRPQQQQQQTNPGNFQQYQQQPQQQFMQGQNTQQMKPQGYGGQQQVPQQLNLNQGLNPPMQGVFQPNPMMQMPRGMQGSMPVVQGGVNPTMGPSSSSSNQWDQFFSQSSATIPPPTTNVNRNPMTSAVTTGSYQSSAGGQQPQAYVPTSMNAQQQQPSFNPSAGSGGMYNPSLNQPQSQSQQQFQQRPQPGQGQGQQQGQGFNQQHQSFNNPSFAPMSNQQQPQRGGGGGGMSMQQSQAGYNQGQQGQGPGPGPGPVQSIYGSAAGGGFGQGQSQSHQQQQHDSYSSHHQHQGGGGGMLMGQGQGNGGGMRTGGGGDLSSFNSNVPSNYNPRLASSANMNTAFNPNANSNNNMNIPMGQGNMPANNIDMANLLAAAVSNFSRAAIMNNANNNSQPSLLTSNMAGSGAGGVTMTPSRRASKWSAGYENPLAFPLYPSPFITGPITSYPTSSASTNPNHPRVGERGERSGTAAPATGQQKFFGNKSLVLNPASNTYVNPATLTPSNGSFKPPLTGAQIAANAFNKSTAKGFGPSIMTSAAAGNKRGRDTSSSLRDRDRERDRSYSRSTSPSLSRGRGGRGGGGRSPPDSNKRSRLMRSSSPSAGNPSNAASASSAIAVGAVNKPSTRNKGGRQQLDYASLTAAMLKQQYHAPALPAAANSNNNHCLSLLDLSSRLPGLYLPADLVSVSVGAMSEAISGGYGGSESFVYSLTGSVPLVFENTPAQLTRPTATTEEVTRFLSDTINSSDNHCIADPNAMSAGLSWEQQEELLLSYRSDILDAPKFTYTPALIKNNRLLLLAAEEEEAVAEADVEVVQRPVKFNAKVLISCGFSSSKDHHEIEQRVDHNFTRKLRLLVGRRKGSLLLLGAPWSFELDGGDPLTDRACLLHTARRAVYAQSLLDLARGNHMNNLRLLGEVTYHRPREEIKGRVYPEQQEITAIFVLSLQPDMLSSAVDSEVSERDWMIFSHRVKGKHAGPPLHRPVSSIEDEDEGEDTEGDDIDELKTAISLSQQLQTWRVTTKAKEDQELLVEAEAAAAAAAAAAATVAANDAEAKEGETAATKEEAEDKKVEAAVVKVEPAKQVITHVEVDLKAETTEEDDDAGHPLVRPTEPSLLLCPMPLPYETSSDPSKRQDGISLRLMPLSTVLTNPPSSTVNTAADQPLQDCNERSFEVSLAAELLLNRFSSTMATLVTDFLLAENDALSCLADQRVVRAVRKLRQLNEVAKAKSAPPAALIAKPATTNAESKEEESGAEIIAVETAETVLVDTPVKQPAAAAEETVNAKEQPEEAKGEDEEAEMDVDESEAEANDEEPASDAQAAEAANQIEDAAVQQEDHQQQQSPSLQDEEEENDARSWRRRFLSACRWFDLQQEKFLRLEVLVMCIHSSSRNVSRADVITIAEDACKDDKLRYEIYI